MAYKYNPFTGNIDLDGGAGGGGWDGTTALDVTVAGVASTPPVKFTGSWFTGGTAETTKPQFLIEPAGTPSTAWSTAGTGLGVNAPSGFAGNLLDLQNNGVSLISIEKASSVNSAAVVLRNSNLGWQGASHRGGFYASSYSGNVGWLGLDTQGTVSFGRQDRHTFGVLPGSSVENGFIGLSNASAQSVGNLWRLYGDATHQLAQRNDTSPQTFRVYNTYTSLTNHERGKLEWASNVFRVGTEKGSGGGTARPMALQTDGADRLKLDTVGSVEIATALTVATLPTSPAVGMIARVTDANAPAIGSTVAGGGAANALVWYNGANWTVLNTVAQALVQSDTTGIAGADAVTNIVSLTQAEYDAIGAPSATTLYIITT
jgi:hypothetical protein